MLNRGRSSTFVLLVAVACVSFASAAERAPKYKDRRAPVAERVDDLLGRMTLEEKVAQITTVWLGKLDLLDRNGRFDPVKATSLHPHGIGQFARPSDGKAGSPQAHGLGIRQTVELVNAVQRHAIERTRLSIPVLFHEEGLHGYQAREATSFPQAIALASSWDPALVRQVYNIVAREIRARGSHLVLAPVIDVARDPRWGRIEETFGEDPYLTSEFGVAAVRGFQGDTLPLGAGKVLATLKHMTGHGQPESGTNTGPANISERVLRQIFFPPFEQAVKRTPVRAVMASYNEIDGIPSHANGWLLNDVLRGEWGYKGTVVSDYTAIEQLADEHHVAQTHSDAAILALRAGVDMDLPDGVAYRTLVESVRAGRITERELDTAVRRTLELKFVAGLFEDPFANVRYAQRITDNAEARALALHAARRSIVLLKNDGVLPLDTSSINTLAVIGPNAAAVRLGGYSGVPRRAISVLQGVEEKLGNRVKIVHAEGARITESDDWWADEVKLADPGENGQRITAAVELASMSDTVVLVLGDTEQTSREAWDHKHMGDRSSLDLVGDQNVLADAILGLGKPTVVVLLNGRPLSINAIAQRANAVVEGWYLGQEGGTAMAEVLAGDVNPGGKLPVTIARSVGQLPMFYNRKPSARRGYLFDTVEPLFPFGFGLSYTTFDIGSPQLSARTIGLNDAVEVSVTVRNTGKRAGDEVVQLYIRDKVSSVTRPVIELKGFERVTLAPGQTKTVRFKLDQQALSLWNAKLERVVEPGEFEIFVGPNSIDLKSATLVVAAAADGSSASNASEAAKTHN